MTYEEIEALLRAHKHTSTIERLRMAVGEEARDLHKAEAAQSPSSPAPGDRHLEAARTFYAEDITERLADGAELDPEQILGHRQRYTHSWAFAEIIRGLVSEDDDEGEEESEEDKDFNDALTHICLANSELAMRNVELIQTVQGYQRQYQPSDAVALQRIREALDIAKAPKLNELGNRDLEVWERVEAVLAAYQEQRGELESCRARAIEEAVGGEQNLNGILKKAAENLIWTCNQIHQSYHMDTGEEWRDCTRGVCGSLGHMLAQAGLDKDLKPMERVP